MAPTLRIFLLLLLSYAGFFQAATWGAACRFDLARALAERGTIVIDAYHLNTGDKAYREGRHYSDKAPLPSFLAAPGVAAAHGLRAVTGQPTSEAIWLAIAGGLATAFATGAITALGGAVFFRILRERGMGDGRAAAATALVFLGTTLFPYGTVLQEHAPAAAWLLLFFHAVFPGAAGRGSGRRNAPRGAVILSWRRGLLAGLAASAALATEYQTGPPLVVLAAFSLWRHRGPGGRGAARLTGALVAGAAPGLALLGLYHDAAFGSPFSLGYQYVAMHFFREKMAAGLFGITAPDPVVAARLLFGPYRGLFFASPVLLLAVPGLALLLRNPARRLETIAGLVVFLYYLALNAGYSSWHGGWAIGPRHLVPAVPFLGLGVAAVLARWPERGVHGPRLVRALVVVLAAVSVLFMLAATAVQPEVYEEIPNPLFDHLLPHFFRAEFSIGEHGFGEFVPGRIDPAVPDRWDAFLIGEALRLPGPLALAPLLAVWLWLGPWRPWRRLRPERP